MSESGILTMCYEADWHKAIGLSLCLRARSTKLPTAVVAPETLRAKLEPYFDNFIPERTDLRGFMHKVYLDEYSPFTKTLFLDADMLVFRDPQELFDRWAGNAYMARGRSVKEGKSSFGLDRARILERLNKKSFACIDGAGHAYFEKPACHVVFNRAREVLQEYSSWAPSAAVADEDILGIVMTELDIHPELNKQVVGFPKAILKTIAPMDPVRGTCEYIDLDGDHLNPLIMHFPRDMSPLLYHKHLALLSTQFQGPKGVIFRYIGWKEWGRHTVLHGIKRKLKSTFRRSLPLDQQHS